MEGTLEVFKFSPFILEEAQKEKAVLRSTHGWMEDLNLRLRSPGLVIRPHDPRLHTFSHSVSERGLSTDYSLPLNTVGNS